MKVIIVSIFCRLLAFLGILAFVFGVTVVFNNPKLLWLLLLLPTVGFVPKHDLKEPDPKTCGVVYPNLEMRNVGVCAGPDTDGDIAKMC